MKAIRSAPNLADQVYHAILDEKQDWSRDVRKITNKRGVDMVVDSTGKARTSTSPFLATGASMSSITRVEGGPGSFDSKAFMVDQGPVVLN